MVMKRFTTEQTIRKLREAEALQGQGKTVTEVCRAVGRRSCASDRRRHRFDH